tara:strand:- start:307 stop:756 length:450 start_codon:yes stop_codon:yes gene_type:complete
MKFFYLIIFLFSISFFQNEIEESDVLGKWEIKIKLKQIVKEQTKELDFMEKMAAKLASDFAEDLVNNIDMFILFKQENKAILTLDYKSFSEQQEVGWSINENYEIVIDDSFNKKINIGSGNNKWILKDDAIFIKNKDEINKNIILQKAF